MLATSSVDSGASTLAKALRRLRRRRRRSRRLSFLPLAAALLCLLLAPANSASGQRQLPIVEQIAQAFVLSELEAYLVFSGVAAELNGTDGRTFTMFPLTNQGWSDVPYARKLQTPAWLAHTASFVRRYIHEEVVIDGESSGGPYSAERTITMLDGSQVTVELAGSRPTFNGVRYVAQAECTDGYLYMLSWSPSDWPAGSPRYFAPAWENHSIADAVASLPSGGAPHESYSIIKDVVSQYIANNGLYAADLLAADVGTDVALTFLAPTDAAFDNAGLRFRRDFCGAMSTPQAMAELEALVHAHLLHAVVPSILTTPGLPVTTASGTSWTWRRVGSGSLPTVSNGTKRIGLMPGDSDRLSIAGIVHGVDAMLGTGTH